MAKHKLELEKPSAEVIVRSVALVVTWLNMFLAAKGWNPIPFTDTEVGEGVSALLAFGATVWAWWKNNSVTPEAVLADEVLRDLKEVRD